MLEGILRVIGWISLSTVSYMLGMFLLKPQSFSSSDTRTVTKTFEIIKCCGCASDKDVEELKKKMEDKK